MGMMIALGSLLLILVILVDSFETTVLPRRVTHRFRFARLFYQTSWRLWRWLAVGFPRGSWRESFLSLFGPLSLLALLANWVLGLILGFALIHWSLDMALQMPERDATFLTHLYMSGVTFFTLGYGDVTPLTPLGRALAASEAGIGFGFLAVIIGYLPVIYQVFSRREVLIALMDARASSPPSAAQLLIRLVQAGDLAAIDPFLAECERWSAELLESHLSFPVLAYYRSQHDNQSWLATLTTILDTCAFLLVALKNHPRYQAQLTFAMARHVVVDLALVFKTPPVHPDPDRLPARALQELRMSLQSAGLPLQEGPAVESRLAELRGMYEPFINALASHFLLALPLYVPESTTADNWQRSAWMKRAPQLGNLPLASTGDGHFE